MTTVGAERDDLRAVERRIARELARLSAVRPLSGQFVGPPAYVCRHLAEHAHAGGILNEGVLPPRFLPYIDLPRLREVATNWEASDESATSCRPSLPLLPVLRQVSHLWDFERPTANAGALQMWAASAGHPPFDPGEPHPWRALWARWSTGPGEILGQHPGPVWAVATTVLPDGRPVAVTGSGDAMVRIWDLTTGAPLGDPLTGHTDTVAAVATVVLPDGRSVAVTGSGDATVRIWDLTTGTPLGDPLTGHTNGVMGVTTVVLPDGRPVAVTCGFDATVRIWDLQRMAAVQEPLHLVGPAQALAALHLPTGIYLAVTGDGITSVELRHQAL